MRIYTPFKSILQIKHLILPHLRQNIYTSGRFFNYTFINKIFDISTKETHYNLPSIDFYAYYYAHIYGIKANLYICLVKLGRPRLPNPHYNPIYLAFYKIFKLISFCYLCLIIVKLLILQAFRRFFIFNFYP